MKKLLSFLLCAAILVPTAASASAAKDDTAQSVNNYVSSGESVQIYDSRATSAGSQLDVYFEAKQGDTVTVYITLDSQTHVGGLLGTLSFNTKYLDFVSSEFLYADAYENHISRGLFYYSLLLGSHGRTFSDNDEIAAYTFTAMRDIPKSSSYVNFSALEYYDIDLNDLPYSQIGYKVDVAGDNSSDNSTDSQVHTHTIVTDPAVEATCTSTGLTEGSHCSVCGEVIVAQTEVPKTDHKAVIDPAVEATCTSTGLTEGSHCSVCGEVIVAQTEIPKTDHKAVIDPAVEATCTSTGLTEGSHCSVCGEIIQPQSIIPMTSHHEVVDPAVAPTETESGLTEGSHCSVCGTVLVAQRYLAPLGHTHTIVIDPAVEATCTSTGLTEGSHCSDCGEIIIVQEEIPKKPHEYVDGKCVNCGEPDPSVQRVYGDLDDDGEITANDAILVLQRSIEMKKFTDLEDILADVDGDEEITSADAILILRASIGIDTHTQIGERYTG